MRSRSSESPKPLGSGASTRRPASPEHPQTQTRTTAPGTRSGTSVPRHAPGDARRVQGPSSSSGASRASLTSWQFLAGSVGGPDHGGIDTLFAAADVRLRRRTARPGAGRGSRAGRASTAQVSEGPPTPTVGAPVPAKLPPGSSRLSPEDANSPDDDELDDRPADEGDDGRDVERGATRRERTGVENPSNGPTNTLLTSRMPDTSAFPVRASSRSRTSEAR